MMKMDTLSLMLRKDGRKQEGKMIAMTEPFSLKRTKGCSLRVKCETCPINDFCQNQTMVTCPLLKMLYESGKEK